MQAGLNILTDLRILLKEMDGCQGVLAALMVMLEHPDAALAGNPSQRLHHLREQGVGADTAIEAWQSNVTLCADAITRAQMNIIEAIAHGTNAHSMDGRPR